MSAKTLPTAPFKRTRRDHASETAEDYVEAIAEITAEKGACRAADLVRLFGVSAVTVSKTVRRLRTSGLVDAEPYGPLSLTQTGEKLAETSRQRHEVVLKFLLAIGVSEENARIDAEGMEHHASEETLARMRDTIKRIG